MRPVLAQLRLPVRLGPARKKCVFCPSELALQVWLTLTSAIELPSAQVNAGSTTLIQRLAVSVAMKAVSCASPYSSLERSHTAVPLGEMERFAVAIMPAAF